MKPLRAVRCYAVKELPPLHILFSEEDGVIVARCLDFSISSHGETFNEARESINSALMDYMEYGIEHGAGDSLFDPDLQEYWDAYRELVLFNSPQRHGDHRKTSTQKPEARRGFLASGL